MRVCVEREREREMSKQPNNSTKKSRKTQQTKPPSKKMDDEIKTRLEIYPVVAAANGGSGVSRQHDCKNCWLAYRQAKEEILFLRKADRQKKKENDARVQTIRNQLTEASRLEHWAKALESNGRENEAEKVMEAAQQNLQDAVQGYRETLTTDEKDLLSPQEVQCVQDEVIPSYPYRAKEVEKKEMELKEYGLFTSDLIRRLESYEALIRAIHETIEEAAATEDDVAGIREQDGGEGEEEVATGSSARQVVYQIQGLLNEYPPPSSETTFIEDA